MPSAVTYRKMWLGGAESDRFSAGPEPVVVDVDGMRLGLGICKDTDASEHARATAAVPAASVCIMAMNSWPSLSEIGAPTRATEPVAWHASAIGAQASSAGETASASSS
jgi:predicted amidohydrolase